MSSYSELIKSFERIRSYMREFYVYGFKSREEYNRKSARSYDDERRRIESWLGDYMSFVRTPEGKNVFISIDSRVSLHNPFYKALKAKSFTDGDITLHFILFDILYSPDIVLSLNEIAEEIDKYLSGFKTPKVSVRINFVCNYRVTDYVRIMTEIDDFAEQIHVAAQLALRDYVGKYKLDEILENKTQMSEFVFERLKAKEKGLFVEINDVGVKDIILPGEIREIMNTVLIAEKRAQANVITRREEVASTRSLLNTAKLMDENKTLYKLKELEHIERICENVGNISLNGSGDVLTQLTGILRGNTQANR